MTNLKLLAWVGLTICNVVFFGNQPHKDGMDFCCSENCHCQHQSDMCTAHHISPWWRGHDALWKTDNSIHEWHEVLIAVLLKLKLCETWCCIFTAGSSWCFTGTIILKNTRNCLPMSLCHNPGHMNLQIYFPWNCGLPKQTSLCSHRIMLLTYNLRIPYTYWQVPISLLFTLSMLIWN